MWARDLSVGCAPHFVWLGGQLVGRGGGGGVQIQGLVVLILVGRCSVDGSSTLDKKRVTIRMSMLTNVYLFIRRRLFESFWLARFHDHGTFRHAVTKIQLTTNETP